MQGRSTPNPLAKIAGPNDTRPAEEMPIQEPEPLSFDFGFELDDQDMSSPRPTLLRRNSQHCEPSAANVEQIRSEDRHLDHSPVLFRPSLRLVPE